MRRVAARRMNDSKGTRDLLVLVHNHALLVFLGKCAVFLEHDVGTRQYTLWVVCKVTCHDRRRRQRGCPLLRRRVIHIVEPGTEEHRPSSRDRHARTSVPCFISSFPSALMWDQTYMEAHEGRGDGIPVCGLENTVQCLAHRNNECKDKKSPIMPPGCPVEAKNTPGALDEWNLVIRSVYKAHLLHKWPGSTADELIYWYGTWLLLDNGVVPSHTPRTGSDSPKLCLFSDIPMMLMMVF